MRNSCYPASKKMKYNMKTRFYLGGRLCMPQKHNALFILYFVFPHWGLFNGVTHDGASFTCATLY